MSRAETRLMDEIHEAADRWREAEVELNDAIALARGMGLTDAQIEQARSGGSPHLIDWPSRRDHIHGAWCHPSADGCPDRPGA